MALKVAPAAAELNIKMTNILKIEKLLNDSSYRELIEFSSNFNARLCLERKLRMPFLDPQTQIAQKHSNLYHKKSQRLPGLKEGQIYTYPSPRWRCRKNTNKFSSRPFYRFRATDNCTTMVAASLNTGPPLPSSLNSTMTSVEAEVNGDLHSLIDAESNSLGAADTDSKDSQNLRDESMMSKDWFYDDMDANDVASEEQPDSDFEFNLNGYKRKRKPVTTRKSSRKPKEQGEASNKKSRPSSSASSASRSNRNSSRKPASKSKAASGKNVDTTNRNFADVDRDPPSFADVDPHFRGGDIIDGAYF